MPSSCCNVFRSVLALTNAAEVIEPYTNSQQLLTNIKILIFVVIWIFIALVISLIGPMDLIEVIVTLTFNKQIHANIDIEPTTNKLFIKIKGQIDVISTMYPELAPPDSFYVNISLENFDEEDNVSLWKSRNWPVYIARDKNELATIRHYFEIDDILKIYKEQYRSTINGWDDPNVHLRVTLLSTYNESLALYLTIDSNPLNMHFGSWCGIILLIFLYILVGFNIADRTFSAIFSCTAAVGVLCLLGKAPTVKTIMLWIDMQTMILLFSMMVMVSVLSETGLYDYVSMLAYQMSRGHVWRLLFNLYMLTALLSAFWTTATIVLLLVPITIRLSEILELRTQLILIGVAIFANIGGTLTPLGGHQNLIVASNRHIYNDGITFFEFTLHMLPGVLLSMIVSFVLFYLMVRNRVIETTEQKLDRLIEAYERKLLLAKSQNEIVEIRKRLEELRNNLNQHQRNIFEDVTDFEMKLQDIKSKYKITDKPLLIKCCIAFGFACLMFLLHASPWIAFTNVCWTAILANLLLLILIDVRNVEHLIQRIEWSTMIFLAALFIFMEALVRLGLIDYIGDQTFRIIAGANTNSRMLVAIVTLVWVGGIASALVNNIPIATVLSHITIKLAFNSRLGLPLRALIWAMCFGTGLGANGCLLGSASNIVVAGVAFKHGHDIGFFAFLIIGLPIMIITCLVATTYLILAHDYLGWH